MPPVDFDERVRIEQLILIILHAYMSKSLYVHNLFCCTDVYIASISIFSVQINCQGSKLNMELIRQIFI